MTKIAGRFLLLLLFFYSLSFSVVLVYGAFSRGISAGNIASLIPFVPLVIYFLREFSYQGKVVSSHRDDLGRISTHFRLLPFLTQGSLTLNLTLLLFLTTAVLTTLRHYNILFISTTI